MDRKIALIPFARVVVEKAAASVSQVENQVLDIERIKNQVDDVILADDADMEKDIEKLIEDIRPEPRWAIGARALIRPIMTLVLTLTFIILILGQVGLFGDPLTGEAQKNYKEVFTIFLGIYGPIIGFWFGERTAERAPRK